MLLPTIEVALRSPGSEMRRTLSIDHADGFGLLERIGGGWALCIPDGARASFGDQPVDLRALPIAPSGERQLPYAFDRSARIDMAEFSFEIRAA
ncbi:MAG: hypothetical protein KF729_28775 [Sandaracinaceae bacterium]|nr:hypothetical protein [Sandaracinaceae bacterium]